MAKPPDKRPGAAFRVVEQQAGARRTAARGPWDGMYQRGKFDFSEVSPETVVDGICGALDQGAAVTISLTSDGGAVKVTLWLDNRKHFAYAGDAETLNEIFATLVTPAEPLDIAAAD
jgi:hypothetical protein